MFNKKLKERIKKLEEENKLLRMKPLVYPEGTANDYTLLIKKVVHFAKVSKEPVDPVKIIDFIRTELSLIKNR